jgi:hypothetical protein
MSVKWWVRGESEGEGIEKRERRSKKEVRFLREG